MDATIVYWCFLVVSNGFRGLGFRVQGLRWGCRTSGLGW